MDEKVYTVNLRDAFEKPRGKRSPKAIGIIRAFVARHTKTDVESIRVSNKLNAIVWARGIQKPPRRVKVKVAKNEGVAFVYHIDEKIEQPKPEKKGEKKEELKEAKAEAKKEEKPEKAAEKKPQKKPEPKKEDK